MSTVVADPPEGRRPAPEPPPAGRRRRRRGYHLDLLAFCKVLVLGFFALFLIIPLLSMVIVAFTGETVNILGSLVDSDTRDQSISNLGGASLATFVEVLGSTRNMEALRNSLLLALGVSLLAMLLCTPIAYGFARTAMPFKRTLGVLCTIPMVVPTFAAAGGFITMFGQAGWVTNIWQMLGGSGQIFSPYSMTGLILAVARAAGERNLPFIAVRAISDQANEVLPAIMATFVDAEGQTKVSAVLAALILRRVGLGALLRAGGASRRAHRALLRCRGALAGLR